MQVFTGIGLRHLLVVDSAGTVVGMITRKDLVSANRRRKWKGEYCIVL
jgi:CBS-domain-containing membrane protein